MVTCAGHKGQLHWFRTYVVAVLSTPGQQDYPPTFALQIFDLRNKLIAISVPLSEVDFQPLSTSAEAPITV